MTTYQQAQAISNIFVLDVLCDKTTSIKKCQNKNNHINFTYTFNESYHTVEEPKCIKLCVALVQNLDFSYSIIMMKHFTSTDLIKEHSYLMPYEELSEAISEYLRYIDAFYTMLAVTDELIYEIGYEMNHIEITNIMKML